MLPISPELLKLAEEVEERIQPVLKGIKQTAFFNQRKVLDAFAKERITEYHLKGTTGYGYDDQGRGGLERVLARVMGAESALVRSQIVSGTHAIALVLYGILRPGDELVSVTGDPYDTLEEIIGLKGKQGAGSLRDWGVTYKQVNLLADGSPDYAGIKEAIGPKTKMVALQRSRGYALRPAMGMDKMATLIATVKSIKPDVVVFVDNCYGELVEEREPTQIGADLIAGSLIKNLGGGMAPTGGYVAGRKDLVELASYRWTAPGIGGAVGASLEVNRALFQGLFQAPHVVGEALQGAVFSAELFSRLGFAVSPTYDEFRSDLVQAIILGKGELVKAFCLGLQQASPVDSFVVPEPWEMPGYQDQVIMAGGTFVQGSTIELSGDAPMRQPYAVYMQGGLNFEHVKLGALVAAQNVIAQQGK